MPPRPGQPATVRTWLSAALLQVTRLVDGTPDVVGVVVAGDRAELIGWHLARRRPGLLVVDVSSPVARSVAVGPPDAALGDSPAIERLDVAYAAVPDAHAAPQVVVGTTASAARWPCASRTPRISWCR